MKKNYVLIDYENVQPEAMAVLDGGHTASECNVPDHTLPTGGSREIGELGNCDYGG